MATINNLIKKIKAILSFHGVSDSDVLKAGNTAYDGLLNNTAFPSLPVPLPTFRQDLDSLSALIVDAEDGGKRAVSALRKQRAEVIRLYTLLGHYVEANSNDDPVTFVSSGFEIRPTNRVPPLPLDQPQISRVDQGKSGECKCGRLQFINLVVGGSSRSKLQPAYRTGPQVGPRVAIR